MESFWDCFRLKTIFFAISFGEANGVEIAHFTFKKTHDDNGCYGDRNANDSLRELVVVCRKDKWITNNIFNHSSLCSCLLRRRWQMHLASQTGEVEDHNRRRDEYNQSVSAVSSQLHIHKHSPSLLVLINL